MKVMVNAISARRGGIVTYTENLIEGLARRQVDATIAVPPELAGAHPKQTTAVETAGFSPLRRVLWEQTVWRRRVARAMPDVLFSSANFGLLFSPVPQVLLVREGGLFDPYYLANVAPSQGATRAVERAFRRWLILLSAKRADHVITPSKAMRDALLLWAPDLADKCTINPYGTVPAFAADDAPSRPWREGGTLRLLYVSVYYPHKNPAVMCEATRALNAEGIPTHARITMELEELDLSGGRYDTIVLKQARDTGLATLGHVDYRELPALYRSNDVFVFPSVSETFGHPMAEALSCGLPIVAADTPINREICGDAALYFSPFRPSDLAGCLKRLDADPALRERMRAEARRRSAQFYKWEDHVDRLVETFQTLSSHE